ncbi:KV6AB protein, partial [Semnornis frantzii]|nr:KV6AB protein [Semnornis frantzii]
GGVPAQLGRLQQSPSEVWARPGQEVQLSCRGAGSEPRLAWYKEEPGGALRCVCRRSECSAPKERYSGKVEELGSSFLIISPVRREDSGVYYCSSFSSVGSRFGDGTRLMVTGESPAGPTAAGHGAGAFVPPSGTPFPSLDAAQPQLSILVPVDSEEPGQPPGDIPLLCQLRDVPPGWHTVEWQPSGEVTPVAAVTVDSQSVPSAWSITWVPAERW